MIYVNNVTEEEIRHREFLQLSSQGIVYPTLFVGGSDGLITLYAIRNLGGMDWASDGVEIVPLDVNKYPELKLCHKLIRITLDEFNLFTVSETEAILSDFFDNIMKVYGGLKFEFAYAMYYTDYAFQIICTFNMAKVTLKQGNDYVNKKLHPILQAIFNGCKKDTLSKRKNMLFE